MTDLSFDAIRIVLEFLCPVIYADSSHTDEESARNSFLKLIRPPLLVNRTWSLAAQFRAVQDVWIWRSSQARAFVTLLIRKPLIAASVYRIVLGSPKCSEDDTVDTDILTIADCVMILSECPNLHCMVVHNKQVAAWKLGPQHLRVLSTAGAFSCLQDFRMNQRVHYRSLCELLLLMPSLEMLYLAFVEPAAPPDRLPVFQLKKLAVRFAGATCGANFSWLLHSSSKSLRELEITHGRRLDVRSDLISTLEIVGKGLTSLTLAESISRGPGLPSIISSCPNLTHLSFDPNPRSPELRNCLRVLPSTLRTLRLSYIGPQCRDWGGNGRFLLGNDARLLQNMSAMDHLDSFAIEVDQNYDFMEVPVEELRLLEETCREHGVKYSGPNFAE